MTCTKYKNRHLYSKSSLAREFGIHRNTVTNLISKSGLAPKRRVRNADLYTIEDFYPLLLDFKR